MKELRTIESTGRSIDEAIYNGLRELSISIDEVDIEIIQNEQKGVFGLGSKPAVVRLIEREPELNVAALLANDAPAPRREQPAPRREQPQRESQPRRNDQPRRDDRPRRDQQPRRDDRPRREEHSEPAPSPYNYEKSVAEGHPATEFLKGALERMGVTAEILGARDEGALRLRIDSDSMGILIGHRGETLDALQYITGLAVNRGRREDAYERITLDVEGYREKREETLTRLARRVAGQVRQSGRPRALEPMNPYERRILHSALQNSPYVVTYSEGEGLDRRVIIAPKPR